MIYIFYLILGFVMDYYIPRWTLFVDTLRECLINNSTFDKDKFRQKVFTNVEQPFTFSKKIYPVEPIGKRFLQLTNESKKIKKK